MSIESWINSLNPSMIVLVSIMMGAGFMATCAFMSMHFENATKRKKAKKRK